MSSISEFERTKPTVTMKKLKTAINDVNNRLAHTESRSEQLFLESLHKLLNDTVKSLKKGE